ncbi:alpha/beta fold hydrolase [Nonomuraea sp. SYSU D8015]|uniref:alpha/beta fold hydrolase n=1 Tax=Nonomuraea sp. SYSU D8015 TaxID=2593644 RepID=UPI001660BB99|nr:hypothetical protein [Nonomuraea sp. SYSU D8015]
MPIAHSNSFKISYEVVGDGPPVVLHPGMFQDAAHWAHSGYTRVLTSAYTVIAVAAHAPDRLTCLVTGGFDAVDGFRSAVGPTLRPLGLPVGTDPYQAALIEAGDPAAFRADHEAFSREPGLHAEPAASGVPVFLYAAGEDPWHEPMRAFAERTGSGLLSLPGADHKGGWDRSADVLPR